MAGPSDKQVLSYAGPSMARQEEPGPIAASFIAPVGWPTVAIGVLAVIFTFFTYASGEVPFMGDMPVVLFWAILLLVWTIRCLICFILSISHRVAFQRGHLRTLLIPTLAILTYISVQTYVPLRLRFFISQHSLNQFARRVAASKRKTIADQSVGLFFARNIEREPDGTVGFTLAEVGFVDPGSIRLEHNPGGAPAEILVDLGGGWYVK